MGLFSGESLRGAPAAQHEDRSRSYQAVKSPVDIGSYSDVVVTADTAVQSVAVRTTVDLIASLVSELPTTVSTMRAGTKRAVAAPDNILDPGGDGKGYEDWVYRVLSSWLLSGNTYGMGMVSGRDLFVDLWNPNEVTCSLVEGQEQWYLRGEHVTEAALFAHWRVNPQAGRVLGLSPIEQHASTLGVSLATTRFGRSWFADGAHPSGMLTNSDAVLDDAQADTAKGRLNASLQGTRDPLVLGRGWGFKEIQISPEESQFLQTSKMSEAQCARIFGPGWAELLGYESGGSMTYSNVVDRRLDALVLSANRWIRRIERVLRELAPGMHIEINREGLLEASTLQRYQSHASALTNKWRTINEVRDIEGLAPVAWGNDPDGVAPATGTAPAPGTEPADDATPTEAEQARAAAELIQKIYLGVGVVLTAEEARNIANRAGAGLPTGGMPDGNAAGL
ncbi:phage portal protein, HK97 family [Promicromonospora umidemergens]|uniref:Phage portal protein n=1 Tax=Promicromonospora umidemergens TaxID=629679 RepID=A0ABP8XG15_9MICO|nr:phage portal protein [Promicromonospora umidemergens]MCP2284872.1 phage portal protein, HK97 family [Promicromonospora umidemergens]